MHVLYWSPLKHEENCFSFRLEFNGTNNIVEYESLLLGLNIAKDYGIQLLHIIDDSDLIVCQVKGTFSCKKIRLKRYRDVVRITTKEFLVISL